MMTNRISILCFTALGLIFVASSAFAACAKPDKAYLDNKMASYSACLSRNALSNPTIKSQSDAQIFAFLQTQTQCKTSYDEAMNYIYQAAECNGKPLSEAQKTDLYTRMQKSIFGVLIKDIKS